jgi:hypothetical protein
MAAKSVFLLSAVPAVPGAQRSRNPQAHPHPHLQEIRSPGPAVWRQGRTVRVRPGRVCRQPRTWRVLRGRLLLRCTE